ncbi:MAG TPA: SRPBCC domain-containing protein [bacterium]
MNDMRFEFYIGGTPERIWQALTSPEDTAKIFAGAALKSALTVGASFEYIGPGPDGKPVAHIYGKVLAAESGRVLSHTCKVSDVWGPDRHKYESRVTYTLEPVPNCIKLILVHDQWMEGDPAYAGSLTGWPAVLSSIKTLVETGKPLDIPMH